MKKKIIGIFVCMLLMATALPVAGAINVNEGVTYNLRTCSNEMGIASVHHINTQTTTDITGYKIAVVNAGIQPDKVKLQLEAWGATVDLVNVPAITAALLGGYHVVWIPVGGAQAVDSAGKHVEILNYMQAGGGLILTQPNPNPFPYTPQCLPYNWEIITAFPEDPPCAATIVDPTHDLTIGLTVDDMPDCYDDVGTVASEYTILALSGAGDPSFACATYGLGRVIISMDAPLYLDDGCGDDPALSEAMVSRMVEWVASRAQLEIENIAGGLGVSASIKNIGLMEAENVVWEIDFEGGIILSPTGGSTTGGPVNIPATTDTPITALAIGFGGYIIPLNIIVSADADNADPVSKTVPAKLLLFIVII